MSEKKELILRVSENGFLCPHCSREEELVPSMIKPISMNPDTHSITLELQAVCPEKNGGCGNILGFVANTIGTRN